MATGHTQTEDGGSDHFTPRNVITKFSGSKSIIRAEVWLNCFLVGTKSQSEEQRVVTLMSYLTDDALNWFGTDIAPHISIIKWSEVSEKFIARFGQPKSDPLVEAEHRKLRGQETVQSYFEDKINLLNKSGLPEERIIAQLTEGMPYTYRISLLCSKAKTAYEWLSIAMQMEGVMRSKATPTHFNPRQRFQRDNKHRTNISLLSNGNSSEKKPKTPCRFCLNAGQTNYHWHNNCPRNPNRRSADNPSQSSTASNTSQSSQQVMVSANDTVQGNDLSGHH